MNENVHINPTLNGGKRELLRCGCDPEKAELDEKGNRMVMQRHEVRDFFKPLGAEAGMYITECAQCKSVLGFGVMLPDRRVARPVGIQLTDR